MNIYIFIDRLLQNKTLQIIKKGKNSSQLKITLPLMTIKSMIESTWAEDMGQFLNNLDPDTRKLQGNLIKLDKK